MQESNCQVLSCISFYMAQSTTQDRTITSTFLIDLLAGYQMLPQLWREILIDKAVAGIELTQEQTELAHKQFDTRCGLTERSERIAWGEARGMTRAQVETIAKREMKLELFKTATWGHCLESYFLTHKSKLDKVIYSLLRTPHQEIATELYFRIEAGEQSFAQCARSYSQGPEAQTGGLLGPMELSAPHPTIAKMLSVSQPGQLHSPIQLGEWFVILRLEKFIPAVLDDTMRQQLLNALFESWIQQEIGEMVKGEWLKEISPPLPLTPTLIKSLLNLSQWRQYDIHHKRHQRLLSNYSTV